jgi:succinate dehydrogenase / fumarate reductase cytochrome b subunit
MATDNRPLSPHLQIYRPQLTSVLSISHRFSGIILSAGLVAVVLWVLAVASGPVQYDRFVALAAHPIGLIGMALWTLALFYHLLNGIRHLLWDAGWLLDLKGAYTSGYMVVAGALVLTVLSWWEVIA